MYPTNLFISPTRRLLVGKSVILIPMPAKNALKEYVKGAYYHLYNRGVNKQNIFQDEQDYKTFLSYLKFYLTAPTLRGDSLKVQSPPSRQLNNYQDKISLISYCLMPNHFHLMIQQHSEDAINYFMRSLATKYVRYFNKKYSRIGPLFQGTYKAVRITNEYQFTYLTKYIHRNPLSLSTYKDSPRRLCHLSDYKYSSYPNYLGRFSQTWITKDDILTYFSKTNSKLSYQSFVEDPEPDDITIIKDCVIDID